MKKVFVLLLGLVLVGCAHLPSTGEEEAATEETSAVEVEVIEEGAAVDVEAATEEEAE